jgi:hypothetical protein
MAVTVSGSMYGLVRSGYHELPSGVGGRWGMTCQYHAASVYQDVNVPEPAGTMPTHLDENVMTIKRPEFAHSSSLMHKLRRTLALGLL